MFASFVAGQLADKWVSHHLSGLNLTFKIHFREQVFIIDGLLINGASLILLGLNELIPIPLVTCTDLFQRSLVCIIHTRHISVAAGQY